MVPESLTVQLSRQSNPKLVEPGPGSVDLELMLQAATTVPDHGHLTPWRFVVVKGAARDQFGAALAASGLAAMGAADDAQRERAAAKLAAKAFLAPTVVVIVASPNPEATVVGWEQTASAACTGYAIALAAHSLGFGAIWKSAAQLDGDALRQLFALTGPEWLLGWVNIGSLADTGGGPQRPRAALSEVVTELDPVARSLVPWRPAG